ncbi:hypothetical protein OCAR_4982 [Afipia carboxidovorans OM5]|nr:hypothetical protein [Afipia carboxidovorans]ACI92118.1 hypothetical protein OCAR_4982 [Afipia carboxidovorans OM5]
MSIDSRRFVIKRTAPGDVLYVTTLHRIKPRDILRLRRQIERKLAEGEE